MPRGAASPWGRKEEHTEGVSRETELKSAAQKSILGKRALEILLSEDQKAESPSLWLSGWSRLVHIMACPASPAGGKKKMESEEAVGETSRQV